MKKPTQQATNLQQQSATRRLVQAAVIACIYSAVTFFLAPLSYGPMQVRVSEALTVLPALTPMGIPGLTLGCLVANLLGPYGAIDAVLGTLATGIGALLSRALRGHDLLVPLPPVLVNGLLVGGMLHYAYGVPGLWACCGWVAAGQLLACYLLGYPLLQILKKHKDVLR